MAYNQESRNRIISTNQKTGTGEYHTSKDSSATQPSGISSNLTDPLDLSYVFIQKNLLGHNLIVGFTIGLIKARVIIYDPRLADD